MKRSGPWIAALLAALALPVAPAAAGTLTVRVADADGAVEAPPWGRVTSSPAGIDCPVDCDEVFAPGTAVTLSATATAGYALARWSALPDDPACAPTASCTVTIGDADTIVEAAFHPAAQLHAVPRGAGTIAISSTDGRSSLCDVDFQQPISGPCSQRYVTGSRVTLTAQPDAGGRFLGWTDYACSNSSRTCTLTAAGERFVAARFSPFRLRIESGAFGGVTVRPGGFCALLEGSPLCEFRYRAGSVVKLRREHGAAGRFWVGACLGNAAGLLDADVCQLRLYGDELVGAGLENVGSIPPALGTGIAVRLGGNKRGIVTGKVIKGSQTLSCGSRCLITGLTSYDRVYLAAKAFRGSRFVRWSNKSRFTKLNVPLATTNVIRAVFKSRRR